MAHQPGLIEGEVEDEVELLESHGEELSNDDLMQMEQQRVAEQEDNENDDVTSTILINKRFVCGF